MSEDGATETITIPMSAYRKLGEVISLLENESNRSILLQSYCRVEVVDRAEKLKAEAWQELGI